MTMDLGRDWPRALRRRSEGFFFFFPSAPPFFLALRFFFWGEFDDCVFTYVEISNLLEMRELDNQFEKKTFFFWRGAEH